MDKPLPSDLDAERAVLGSVLNSPALIVQAASLLKPEHFLDPRHRKLYEVLLTVPPEQFDALLLRQRLTPEVFERLGGFDFLAGLVSAVPSAARLPHYADIVVEHWRLRELVRIGCGMESAAYNRDAGSRELALDALEALYALDAGPAVPTRIGDLLKDALAREQCRLLETGLAEVDALTGGLKGGELTVAGARPGVGKSSLMLSIAANIALRNVPVLFVSFELTEKAVTRRLIAARAEVPVLGMVKGQLSEFQEWRIHQAADELRDWPMHVVSPRERDVQNLTALIRLYHLRYGIGLACVDYIQLVRVTRKAEKRYIEIGHVVADIKAVALELNLPVLAAAQLRRESETRDRPTLADLRESGDIEQTADNVWLLHRPLATVTDANGNPIEQRGIVQDRNIAVLWVAKSRDGETTGHDGIRLHFETPGMRFANYVPKAEMIGPFEPPPRPAQARLGAF